MARSAVIEWKSIRSGWLMEEASLIGIDRVIARLSESIYPIRRKLNHLNWLQRYEESTKTQDRRDIAINRLLMCTVNQSKSIKALEKEKICLNDEIDELEKLINEYDSDSVSIQKAFF